MGLGRGHVHWLLKQNPLESYSTSNLHNSFIKNSFDLKPVGKKPGYVKLKHNNV